MLCVARLPAQCGFSNTCVQILNTLSVPYETVNILEDERLRSGMKEFSQVRMVPHAPACRHAGGGNLHGYSHSCRPALAACHCMLQSLQVMGGMDFADEHV
jgi:hypothetical protein